MLKGIVQTEIPKKLDGKTTRKARQKICTSEIYEWTIVFLSALVTDILETVTGLRKI